MVRRSDLSRSLLFHSCEVIRDQKTQESLQYAFIEFEEEEHCANAYFKMDNVLIDDRRIHVDFSQSVSKLKYADWRKRQQAKAGPQFVIKDRARKEYPFRRASSRLFFLSGPRFIKGSKI